MKSNIWSFIAPLDNITWICILISIPIVILAMGSVEYVAFNKRVDWDTLVGFVLRNVLSENLATMPDKKPHHKILVFAWVWPCFVKCLHLREI